ncbi:Holliday junction branch migration protein RuvA [Nicoliella spurrieriana]|uniref:Holliday junction branch migration complex subunit RuvA n=1 Tax=Nicoliella spurrieriana TaxID=2925830 RepID=A0A976RRZ0_9LACO|nr:Holliday junction branch migration protein RuvA [Nicoliella spurrieriana]UQS86795.1 Holliday junction branch migration protein RuvA [Nicoliella spurrieriana]
MYEYLTGFVTAVTPSYIVLDVNGIGYLLYTADPYRYHVDADKQLKLYVHQVITDSFQSLYAFASRNDKALFEKLINVSGIGPKSANAIMAGNQNQGLLRAINEENITFLTKFPGVGKKTAKQIVLDLKGKLDDLFEADQLAPKSRVAVSVSTSDTRELQDALAALNALGYSSRDVARVKKQLLALDGELDTNQYLSEGLRLLTQF